VPHYVAAVHRPRKAELFYGPTLLPLKTKGTSIEGMREDVVGIPAAASHYRIDAMIAMEEKLSQ